MSREETLINTWRRQALEGMSGIFSGKAKAKAAEKDGEIETLHAKIGQLVVERDFLAKGELLSAIGPRSCRQMRHRSEHRRRRRADGEHVPEARDD